MYRRRNNLLCKFHSILAFCTFRTSNMLRYTETLARWFSIWFYGMRSFSSLMSRRGENWFCKAHFTFEFYTSGIAHMLREIWPLGWCFSVWLRGLCSFGTHMCRCDDQFFCTSYLVLAFSTFSTFGIGPMLTDVWTTERAFCSFFVLFVFDVALMCVWDRRLFSVMYISPLFCLLCFQDPSRTN